MQCISPVLLNTIGCKSGQRRTSPLVYLRDGDRLVVLGSNFGQDHHPVWTSNLLAQSEATVTMARTRHPRPGHPDYRHRQGPPLQAIRRICRRLRRLPGAAPTATSESSPSPTADMRSRVVRGGDPGAPVGIGSSLHTPDPQSVSSGPIAFGACVSGRQPGRRAQHRRFRRRNVAQVPRIVCNAP
ncbi:nitroreductase/quinone reductase family protein [Nocardia sp. CA-151230]|uniref:nitroreductase/quinone reductase family protein n=1 Tax=Nocardia sp. CA-151230 TaxID=3239982 RepID=UPI003D9032AD